MFLDSQVFVQGVMLRTNAKILSDFLELSLTQHFNNTRGGFEHAGKHGNGGSFTSTIVSKEDKNIIVVHIETEVVDSNEVSVIKLLSEVLDFDDFLLSFHSFILSLHLLDVWFGLILGFFDGTIS